MPREPEKSNLDARVASLLDDLAHPDVAVTEISALGEHAIGPVARYLDGPPQSFPHARQLAVRLLGLIGDASAADALRAVLRRHDLAVLSPVLAQSEYAVKDEAVVQLARLGRDDLAEEILRAFRRDRLPAAMEALARWRVTPVIPDLVAALEDDILAERAGDALREFGSLAEDELVRTLAVRRGETATAGESRVSRRRRILAALVLGSIGTETAIGPLRAMLFDPDPTVRAAAAVALHTVDAANPSAQRYRALVCGGMSPEWRVRERCREAARAIGAPCVPAALEALRARTIHDLYGVPQRLSLEDQRWLVALIAENAPPGASPAETALLACEPMLLVEGMALVCEARAAPWVARLARHRDPLVRGSAAWTLARLGGPVAAATLATLANDPVRQVRAAAARALRRLAVAEPDVARLAGSLGRPGGSWLLRLRLRWALRGLGGGGASGL